MNTRITGRLSRGRLSVAMAAAVSLAMAPASAGKPPPPPPPSPPSGLTATAVSASQINLAWSDNSSNETGFKIVRTNPDSTQTRITTGADVASYSDTGLSASSTYSYAVWSTNRGGDSIGFAGPAIATTEAAPPPPPPPPPPSGLTFTAVDIGNLAGAIEGGIGAINEAGTIVGSADLPNAGRAAFVLEPLPGSPNPVYFQDANDDGANDLLELLPGVAPVANDINNSGQIVGTCQLTAYFGTYDVPVIWLPGATGYTNYTNLANSPSSPNLISGYAYDINDAGYIVGYINKFYLYDPNGPWTTDDVANVPFIIVPERDLAGNAVCWFRDEHGGPDGGPDGINDLMIELAVRPYPNPGVEAVAVTNDNCVIINGKGVVRPDYYLPNPWFIDTNGDRTNDLLVPFPTYTSVSALSPNGRLAAGSAGGEAALIDLAAAVPTCTSLGLVPHADGTEASGVNDAEWVVGASYTIENIAPAGPRGHFHERVYSGLFWKAGTMSDFGTLVSNSAVSAALPGVINNSGVVAGTATSAGGQPTMFVAFPSVSP